MLRAGKVTAALTCLEIRCTPSPDFLPADRLPVANASRGLCVLCTRNVRAGSPLALALSPAQLRCTPWGTADSAGTIGSALKIEEGDHRCGELAWPVPQGSSRRLRLRPRRVQSPTAHQMATAIPRLARCSRHSHTPTAPGRPVRGR